MADREPLRPVSDSPSTAASGHRVSDEDIELPPLAVARPAEPTGDAPTSAEKQSAGSARRRGGGVVLLAGAAALGLIAAAWFSLSSPADESGHPNWPQVVAATEAAQTAEGAVVEAGSGTARVMTAIEVASADADSATTNAVRQAMRGGDAELARERILAAQQLPAAADEPLTVAEIPPESQLANDIERGRARFYQMQVFDCCDEDGDVVEILVNGQPLIMIPITHEGATISIPLLEGANSVSLRGVRDGGGGITVSFRTSEGHYFARKMVVGEQHPLGVIVR